MSVCLFGSCRINGIDSNNLNNLINYTHSTKEIIQLIHFLNGTLTIPEPYNMLCFRTALFENKHIHLNFIYNRLFIDTDVFVIEICSRKKYMHNGFYLHHLCVDKRFIGYTNAHVPEDILNNFTIEIQSDEEIENDILEIQNLLYPRKIIIVSHFNSKQNGEYIFSRNNLISLLENICKKNNIMFINPTNVLSSFSQEEVITNDLGHYTDLGLREISNYINSYIQPFLLDI